MFAAVRVAVRLYCSFKTVSSVMLRLTWRALERLDCSMRCGPQGLSKAVKFCSARRWKVPMTL